jgi:Type II secretion system (T2SS), protein E, N-terminal domain
VSPHRQLAPRRPLGEILIEEGWATAGDVASALADQADLGLRLASLLISRGLLDPDQAARALGRQHGVPAALLRHLTARDREVARLLDPDIAHGYSALALAIARDGSVVVCVRDPGRAELRAALEHVLRRPVTLVVASCSALMPLLREVYGAPPDDFEVDMSFGEPAPPAAAADFDAFASGELTLASLDDVGVARGQDLDQPTWLPRTSAAVSGPPPATWSPSVAAAAAAAPRFTPVAGMPALSGKQTPPAGLPALVGRQTPPTGSSALSMLSGKQTGSGSGSALAPTELVTAAAAAMAQAQTRDQVLDGAFAALTPTWSSAVLFSVKDSAALGQRGFGGQLTPHSVATLVIPLQSPSLLRAAWQSRELAEGGAASPVQDRLLRLLGGGPAYCAPVELAGRVVGLLAAASPSDPRAPSALTSLAHALGEHLGRIIRAAKSASLG